VGYFLLTGEHLFAASTVVEVCGHHLHTTPIPPSVRLGRSLPSDLEDLVLSCLQKKPEQRPQSAADLARRLSQLEYRSAWNADARATWWQRVKTAAPDRARTSSGISVARTIAVDFSGREAS
jgi:serine/threonine-protein kinase